MKALCLGGSKWQTDLIRRAGELGLETLVVDIDPGCPGAALADTFVAVDTNDVAVLIEIARSAGVHLVLADQSDRVVMVAAQINVALDLPGLRPEVAVRFTDKREMRAALLGKVPMPAFEEISDAREATAFAEREGYPIVLKPKRAQSSIGVFKVDDASSLEECFPLTRKASQDGRILVERFVAGPEVTVEAFSLEGRCHVLATSEKEHYPFNDCLARRLSYPPRLEDETIATISEIAAMAVESLALQDGISHAEYRVAEGVPYLVEVAARGGGSRIASRVVPHVSGIDIYELLIRRLQGDTVELPDPLQRAAALEFFDFAPGAVRTVDGLDEALEEHLAEELHLAFGPGNSIQCGDNESYVAHRACRAGKFSISSIRRS